MSFQETCDKKKGEGMETWRKINLLLKTQFFLKFSTKNFPKFCHNFQKICQLFKNIVTFQKKFQFFKILSKLFKNLLKINLL